VAVATVVLAYWAPLYVTVDTESGEIVSMRLAAGGLRNGVRVNGQAAGEQAAAARVFAEARADNRLPDVELR
jgi:hypothetical protein